MDTVLDNHFNPSHLFNDNLRSFKENKPSQASSEDIFANDEAILDINRSSDSVNVPDNIPILDPANQNLKEDMTGKHSVEICPETVHPNLKVSQEDFNLLKTIGKGGYGTVYLVQKINPPKENQLFAMKVLKKARIICNEKDTDHTVSERNILKMLKHPFLVKLHYAFQNLSNLYIVLEYCPGGELFSYLERQYFLSEPNACFYTSEITLAIGHLHSLGIIYRDLKLENILLDQDGHVKLTDFGLSKEGVRLTNTFCGTIEYMAPEIIRCQGHGKEVDWWSMGTLLYDMLSGGPPFVPESSKTETANNILYAQLKFPDTFSPEVVSFLKGLLNRDPKSRLGSKNDVEDIKSHTFFRVNNINWDDVFNRRLVPPFKPALKSPTDVSLFDENFTTLNPAVTPSDSSAIIPPDYFHGFSYVGNSVREGFLNEENFSSSARFKRSQMIRNGRSQLSDSNTEVNGIEFKKSPAATKQSSLVLTNDRTNKVPPNNQLANGHFLLENACESHQKSITRVSKMDNLKQLPSQGSMDLSNTSMKISQSIEEAEEAVDTMDVDESYPSRAFFSHPQSDSKVDSQSQKKKFSHPNPSIGIPRNVSNSDLLSHSGPYVQSDKNQNNCVIS